MNNEEKIQKLERALNSKYYPEGLKAHARKMIEELKNPSSSKGLSNPSKNYYSNGELKSVTVNKGGKLVTYSASDVLNGANFMDSVDKKEKGGRLEDKATYYKVSDIVNITTNSGETLKPDNGYWINNDAEPILEYGGIVDASIQNFQIARLEKGGDVNGYKVGDIVAFPNKPSTGLPDVYRITQVDEHSDMPNTYDMVGIAGPYSNNNTLGKMFRPATDADFDELVVLLDIFPDDSSVIYDGKYDDKINTWSWENISSDQIREGYPSETEAFAGLLRYLGIRKALFDFYKQLGYSKEDEADYGMVQKHYGKEITKVALLIDKNGDIKGAFNIVARGEGFDQGDKELFFKTLNPFKKTKIDNKPKDGRKSNGNPIFDLAKKIRKPGESWQSAIQRAKTLLK